MTAPLRTKLIVGGFGALLLFGVIVGVSYVSMRDFVAGGTRAAETRNRLIELERVLSALHEVESAQRAYLLSGNPGFLTAYKAGLRSLETARWRFTRLGPGQPPSRAGVDRANGLLDRKLVVLDSILQAYEGSRAARTAPPAPSEAGEAITDSLRQVIATLEADENQTLFELDAEWRAAARRTQVLVAGLAALGLLLSAGVGVLVWRAAQAHEVRTAALDARVRDRTMELGRINAALTVTNVALDTEVAQRREAEVALERRIAEMETLFAVVPIGIGLALDPECSNIRGNPAFMSMLHLPPGTNASKSGPEGARLPFRVVRHDGTEIPPEDLVMQRAARTGQRILNEEFQIVYPDGGPMDMLGSAAPLFDAEGGVRGAVGAFLDVTDRRRAEAQLEQAQRMQAVGQLAGGVAHDINNMMTTVLGFADLALKQLGPGHPVAADLRQVGQAAIRAAEVTRQLLAFSRQQHATPRLVDLNESIRGMEPTLQQLVGANVGLVLRLKADPALVRIDGSHLEQVLINLAANARDAMPDGGRLTITTGLVDFDEAFAQVHAEIRGTRGPHVMLVVSDTGEGMAPETLRRAFEPFFTTKQVGRGTGLGLSMVYGIVKQAGGYIWLYGDPGQGTTVEVYLPLVAGQAPDDGAEPPTTVGRASKGELILVVEDDAAVRGLTCRTLKAEGYRVLAACDGREALDVMHHAPTPVQLVVTDVVMPNMSGRALGKVLAADHPGLPVLYISGYTGDDVAGRGLLDHGAEFLQKPFTSVELLRRVRRLLDRTPQLGGATVD